LELVKLCIACGTIFLQAVLQSTHRQTVKDKISNCLIINHQIHNSCFDTNLYHNKLALSNWLNLFCGRWWSHI